jgi:hypothetical protein
MQLQVLQTIAANKDPSNFPMKPRQIHVQNSAQQYNNVSSAVDKWLKAMPTEKRAKILAILNRLECIPLSNRPNAKCRLASC